MLINRLHFTLYIMYELSVGNWKACVSVAEVEIRAQLHPNLGITALSPQSRHKFDSCWVNGVERKNLNMSCFWFRIITCGCEGGDTRGCEGDTAVAVLSRLLFFEVQTYIIRYSIKTKSKFICLSLKRLSQSFTGELLEIKAWVLHSFKSAAIWQHFGLNSFDQLKLLFN